MISITTLQSFCTNNKEKSYLLSEWASDKNKFESPDEISCFSNISVWWRCSNGHEWESSVLLRTRGGSCPECDQMGKTTGENDLKTMYPLIAAEWDFEKNNGLLPEEVTVTSKEKVWWKCKQGHSWNAMIFSRALGYSSCPYCFGKKVLIGFNDLKTKNPLVASEWHPTRNGLLRPDDVTFNSNKKVWWKCFWGHEWMARINTRTGKRKAGCPVCSRRNVKGMFRIWL